MAKAIDVKPQKWKNIIILFDDGTYSACWGNYDKSENRVLGVRWNYGYPSQGINPLWYVEPKILTKSILLTLLENVNISNSENKNEYIENILIALKEYI
jgi:hypothetical protein